MLVAADVGHVIAERDAGGVVAGAERARLLRFCMRESGCAEQVDKVAEDVDEVVGRKGRSKGLARPAQQGKAHRPPLTHLPPRDPTRGPPSAHPLPFSLGEEVASMYSFEERA